MHNLWHMTCVIIFTPRLFKSLFYTDCHYLTVLYCAFMYTDVMKNILYLNLVFLSEYIFISQSMNRQTSWRLFCPSFYSEFWEIGTNDNRRFFRSWFPAWLMITTTKQEPSVNRTLISKYFMSVFIVLSIIWETYIVYFSLQHCHSSLIFAHRCSVDLLF